MFSSLLYTFLILQFSSADNILLADDVTAAAGALIGRETAAHNLFLINLHGG